MKICCVVCMRTKVNVNPIWTQDGLGMDSGETLEGPGIDPGGTVGTTRVGLWIDRGWT